MFEKICIMEEVVNLLLKLLVGMLSKVTQNSMVLFRNTEL